jgi:hypothetical protein
MLQAGKIKLVHFTLRNYKQIFLIKYEKYTKSYSDCAKLRKNTLDRCMGMHVNEAAALCIQATFQPTDNTPRRYSVGLKQLTLVYV